MVCFPLIAWILIPIRVRLPCLFIAEHFSHTLINWMTSLRYGDFNEFSDYVNASISCHTLSSWKVSQQCKFVHESSKHLSQSIFSHILRELLNGFSPIWILSWIFDLLDSWNLWLHYEQLYGFSLMWIFCVSSNYVIGRTSLNNFFNS